MSVTRSTHTRCASRWAWLLPLALAELSIACGTSPTTVGESAGAAGPSAGTAGASPTNGGSDTESGGASTGHAGAAGSNASGGVSELGGASGSSNQGGSSAGGSSSAGAGGSGSGACMMDADCGAGFNCLYKIADGCAATGSCFKEPGGVLCMSVAPYCGCSGEVVGVPCYEPFGYSPEPVASQQTSVTCPSAPDAACAGKSCGDSCATGQVPAVCDAAGKCLVAGAPTCK